jgi:hypothetical protein
LQPTKKGRSVCVSFFFFGRWPKLQTKHVIDNNRAACTATTQAPQRQRSAWPPLTTLKAHQGSRYGSWVSPTAPKAQLARPPQSCTKMDSSGSGKSLFFLPQLSQKFTFPPSTSKPDKPPPLTFQTVHFTSLERF